MLIRRHPVSRLMEQVLDDMNEATERANRLPLDVIETGDNYTLYAALPGINPDAIAISVHDDVLTITATLNAPATDDKTRILLQERRYGTYSRQIRFPVPVAADNVTADYDQGVLSLVVPKAEAAKPRQIQVRTSAS